MSDFSKIAGLVMEAAKDLAPLIVPGAPLAIKAGEKLVAALQELGDKVPPQTRAELDAQRLALEARVNAHADETIARLRGD